MGKCWRVMPQSRQSTTELRPAGRHYSAPGRGDLRPAVGETIALVKAPGAGGTGVNNQTGVKTDWRGYAIVPYVSPYRKNQVQLNTETMADDVEVELTSQNVVPTRGAVVRANFQANVGQRILMTLLRQGGAPVPFGATVSNPAQQTARACRRGRWPGLSDRDGRQRQPECEVGQRFRPTVSGELLTDKTDNGKCWHSDAECAVPVRNDDEVNQVS